MPAAGWTEADCCNVGSGVAGVSWTDGSTQRQRVFYAWDDKKIWMVRFDNEAHGGFTLLPAAPSGTEFGAHTDVAAVAWDDDGTPRVAVAAVATDGRVCAWLGNFSTNGSFGTPSCTSTNVASSVVRDIDGTVVNDVPWFGFRNAGLGLSRYRKSTVNDSWFLASLGTPPGQSQIRGSVVAWPSQAETDKVDVAVIGGTGALFAGRIVPTNTAMSSWNALPYSGAPGAEGDLHLQALARDTRAVDADGRPITRSVGRSGETLPEGTIDVVRTFAEEAPLDLDLLLEDVPGDARDATELVLRVETAGSVPDGAIDDGERFVNVQPGTTVRFRIILRADAFGPRDAGSAYRLAAILRLDGVSRLERRVIEIVVSGGDAECPSG